MPFKGNLSFSHSAGAHPHDVEAYLDGVSTTTTVSLLSKLQSQNTALDKLRAALGNEDDALSSGCGSFL